MYCTKCGNKLNDNYKYCPKCGNKIELDLDYIKIKEYVMSNDSISISMIQNEFKLTNSKAKEYINRLESDKVIGQSNGNKKRIVFKKNEAEHINNKDIFNTKDSTLEFNSEDIKNNTFLALLSYLGILALIPYFANNDSKFVKYHATQGMNLLIVWLIYTVLNNLLLSIKTYKIIMNVGGIKASRLETPLFITFPMNIILLALVICSIIGIIYVCEGKAKEIPLINKIKIIK